MTNTATITSPTADQLRMIKVSAANAVSLMLREEIAYYREGITKGFLSDSSMDNVLLDPSAYTVHHSGFAGNIDRVIVRTQDDRCIQDYIVSVTFGRPFIPSSFSIKEDMRAYKD